MLRCVMFSLHSIDLTDLCLEVGRRSSKRLYLFCSIRHRSQLFDKCRETPYDASFIEIDGVLMDAYTVNTYNVLTYLILI